MSLVRRSVSHRNVVKTAASGVQSRISFLITERAAAESRAGGSTRTRCFDDGIPELRIAKRTEGNAARGDHICRAVDCVEQRLAIAVVEPPRDAAADCPGNL